MPSRIFVNSEHSWQNGEGIFLSKDQKHYLQKVLRLRDSDRIEIVNKTSHQVFLAELIDQQSKATLISEIPKLKSLGTINLIFAYCKSTKNETIIEKCTELGVDNFIIYQGQHSIAKLSESKSERLEKIAEAASCQSKRNTIPKIYLASNPTKLTEVIKKLQEPKALSLIASLQNNKIKIPMNLSDYKQINLAVGPEGDFTLEEYQLFSNLCFLPISLGRNILRSETAAIAGISLLSLIKAQS